MTSQTLGEAYLWKAQRRLRVLDVLMEEQAYSDMVREAQEVVELALKALLRFIGVDPPKWHDVGPLLLQFEERLPEPVRRHVGRMAEISAGSARSGSLLFVATSISFPQNSTPRRMPSGPRTMPGSSLNG